MTLVIRSLTAHAEIPDLTVIAEGLGGYYMLADSTSSYSVIAYRETSVSSIETFYFAAKTEANDNMLTVNRD